MSREYTRHLIGRVLELPETDQRPEVRLRIVQVRADATDPKRVIVHGIRLDRAGRELEGVAIALTPFGINYCLQ